MSEPQVAVVIPTRNRLPFLREAVTSVQHQDLSAWELVIVDDDSTDGTREWLRSIEVSRLRVVEPDDHLERSAARNLGLSHVRAANVLFLDDDDRLTPDALRRLLEELTAEPEAVAAVGNMVRFDRRGAFKTATHARRRVRHDVLPDVLLGWVGTTGRSLVRSEEMRRIGGFDEGMAFGEDWDMWLRLAGRGPVVLVPDTVLEYRVHPGQTEDPGTIPDRDCRIADRIGAFPPDRRARAQRALDAWAHHGAGLDAMGVDDGRGALRHFARAWSVDRSLYLSPLQRKRMRDPLLMAVSVSVLGRRGARALRRVRELRRR